MFTEKTFILRVLDTDQLNGDTKYLHKHIGTPHFIEYTISEAK